MRVVAVKAQKMSSQKAVLIVRFISPPSLRNAQMQLFCTSLEPNTKKGQGADLSILTALKITKPSAKSLFDLGVRCKPRSDSTLNSQRSTACWAAPFLMHHKRHLMTLKRQNKTFSVTSTTCDHVETRSATPKAHLIQYTTVKRCKVQ